MVANTDKPVMLVERVDDWEAWLEAHPDHDGVRLQLRKKASTEPGITYDEALESALCFGWIDGQTYGLDADYFLQVFTPRRPRSVWSGRNVDIVARLTAAGRMRGAGIEQVERARADGRWEAAYRQGAAVVPADLRAALDASPAAAAAFEALAPEKRFRLVLRITGLRGADARASGIAAAVDALAHSETPG